MSEIAVPFFRPSLGEEEIAAVVSCLRSGWLTTGPKTREFEEAFANHIGEGVAALAVNSATAGLHLALEALAIGPDDEVIVPTLTFTATAEVVRYLGARPVLVDIDPHTLCIDIQAFEDAITPKTKAVMPVHFAGRPCDMTELNRIARRNGIKVVADAAHALPAFHAGVHVGHNDSDATVFSFYANKTMTTGEGGMLVARDPEVMARCRIMRLHGIDRDVFNRFTSIQAGWLYDVVAPGYKYNLTDIASALGLVQLSRLASFHDRRTRLVGLYDEAFRDLPVILPPQAAKSDAHSWHLYILQLRDDAPVGRDELISRLKQEGIGTSVHYRPLHQMTVWKTGIGNRRFVHADSYFGRCLSLPLFMDMREEEQAHVINAIRRHLT